MDLEIFKGYVDILILCVLKNGDSYGYDIAKTIRKESDMSYMVGEGTLYTSLRRLEKKLLVQSYWEMKNDRNRKYYRITDEGVISLKEKIQGIKQLNSLIENITGGSINE